MLMAAGFAIEVAYSVETNYAIPALLDTGLEEKYASIMWVFGPLLGIIFQGYLGSASDNCKCSWGKRRPFIFALGVCLAISMALFAYRRVLFGGNHEEGGVTLFVFTAVSFVAMDFSMDQFESPVRMYLLDSVTIETSNRANDIYLAMLALGSLFGSMISAIDWDSTQHSAMHVEYQVQVVFTITLILFIVGVTITMFSVKEGSFRQQSLTLDSVPHTVRPRSPSHITWPREDLKLQPDTFLKMNGMSCGVESNVIKNHNQSQKCSFLRDIYNSFLGTKEFISCLSNSMKLLWLTVFLDWCVFLSKNIFFTDFVGKVVYGGSPSPHEVTLNSLYEEGVRVACWCVTIEDVVIIVYSLLLSERISGLIGHGPLLIGGHIMHFFAMGMTMMAPSVYSVMVMSVSSAIFVANLLTIPYTLIPYYKVRLLMLGVTPPERLPKQW